MRGGSLSGPGGRPVVIPSDVPSPLLVPSHLPVNMGEQSQRSFDAISPSRIPEVEAGAVQKKCLTKLEILRRELEWYRSPYRLCLTTELGGPAAMRCVNQHSIRFGALNGDKGPGDYRRLLCCVFRQKVGCEPTRGSNPSSCSPSNPDDGGGTISK